MAQWGATQQRYERHGERQRERMRERQRTGDWAWGFVFIGVESGDLSCSELSVYR